MSDRLSIWEWAKRYCGDPDSWSTRGAMIVELLREEGMTPESKVLELGCGNLSQGKQLIEFLEPDRYVGVDPNGWLVEVALAEFPHLETKAPRFSWASDFDASEFNERFDFVVAHSVLSHAAHWQMEMCLARTRDVVDEGAVFLASLRLGEQNSFAPEWCYPHVSFFRFETLRVLGFHAGWHVEHLPNYRLRMETVAPADIHDWVLFRAVPTAEEQNRLRLDEEVRLDAERTFSEEAAQRRKDEVAARPVGEQRGPPSSAAPPSSDNFWLGLG